jgi:hypothetical protein
MTWWDTLISPFRAPNGIHDERLDKLEAELRIHEARRDASIEKITAVIARLEKAQGGEKRA